MGSAVRPVLRSQHIAKEIRTPHDVPIVWTFARVILRDSPEGGPNEDLGVSTGRG